MARHSSQAPRFGDTDLAEVNITARMEEIVSGFAMGWRTCAQSS